MTTDAVLAQFAAAFAETDCVMAAVDALEDEVLFSSFHRPRKPVVRLPDEPRRDYSQTLLYDLCTDLRSRDDSTPQGQRLRRKLRVPWTIFNDLLELAKKLCPCAPTDITGRPSVPYETKLAGWLKLLGRGHSFDDLEDCTRSVMLWKTPRCELTAASCSCSASYSTHFKFFHQFTPLFVAEKYDEWVHLPRTPSELAAVMQPYEDAGLPGCMGSIDCTHVYWNATPAGTSSCNFLMPAMRA
jgi:hypothetical protein